MRVVKFAAKSMAAYFVSAGMALAGPLTYQGVNLEQMGLYKSAGLPGDIQVGLYGSTFDTGFHVIPEDIQGGTILLFPIEGMLWASGTQDSSGHKVPGIGSISSTAENIRPFTVLPDSMQPANPHFKMGFDMIIPAMVTVHSDAHGPVGEGIGGSGLGDISTGPAVLIVGYGNSYVRFSGAIETLFDLPTGSYNQEHIFNVGSNEFGFSTYGVAVMTFPKLDNLYSSTLMEYTHTISGNTAFVAGTPALTQMLTGSPSGTYTTGDLFTFNTDLLYPVTPVLAIGPSFSFLDQVSDDTWNGATVHNSGQFAAGAGFGFQYRRPGMNFQVKYINTFTATNMPKYNVIAAQVSIPFEL